MLVKTDMSEELKFANIYRRGLAFLVDEVIVLAIRIVIIGGVYIAFFQNEMKRLAADLYGIIINISETATIIDLWNQVIELQTIKLMIIFIFCFCIIHPIYQFIMYKYYGGQTFGKKLIGIVVLSDKWQKMSIADILARIIFSYLPWVLPFVIYYLYIISNGLFIPIALVWLFWYDPWILFNRRGKTVHDILSGTFVYCCLRDEESQ